MTRSAEGRVSGGMRIMRIIDWGLNLFIVDRGAQHKA